ncbi:MAG TPA: hypothetical protein VKD04_06540 [Burkholderiales bacterium]|nr:hypothetical protein [Burkholderiales bacterium]
MARSIRIALLLFVLASVAAGAWHKRALVQSWERTLDVVVYPINGDGREATAAYLASLSSQSFASIGEFMRDEARRHGLALANPLSVKLGPQVASAPPPAPVRGNTLEIILWSLRLRFWAWRNDAYTGPKPDVRVFAVYFDPAVRQRVEHSIGLKEGQIGIANVFAVTHMTQENNVIVSHEILHTFGATDKYDPATAQPLYPDGYADPGQSPLYPQQFAEIMGGRIPLSETQSETPRTLDLTTIGERTAGEIHWRR